MKSILSLVCIGSLALALTAGADQDKDKRSAKATPQHRTATVQTARPAASNSMRTARSYNSTAQNRQQTYTARRTSSASNRATRPASVTRATARDGNIAVNRTRNVNTNREQNVTANRTRNVDVNRERNVTVNRTARPASAMPATTNVNRARNANEFRNRNNVATNRNRNVTVNRTTNAAYYRGPVRVTNSWRGNAFRGQRYTVFRNYHRQWHDRSWWRSHYNRIVFVNNGWWYWNSGYWFPAWGYAPYVTFAFDGPIYGYNGLTPDQVTVNVQQQLAAAGYYDGPIDGVLGPTTREAIAAYQADNGLAVTSAIDEPTLATMGLV